MTTQQETFQQKTDRVFIEQVCQIAKASTCDRAHVGAILAKDGLLLSTGVNTSANGLPTCEEQGHLMIEGHCCRTIHAEANAIYNAGKFNPDNVTLYITHEPCVHCRKLIVQFGIKRVVYYYTYRSNIDAHQISGDVEWIHYNGI